MRNPRLLATRQGAAMVEYVLLIALLAVCLIAILAGVRNAASGAYARTSTSFSPMSGPSPGGGGGGGGVSPGDPDSSATDSTAAPVDSGSSGDHSEGDDD